MHLCEYCFKFTESCCCAISENIFITFADMERISKFIGKPKEEFAEFVETAEYFYNSGDEYYDSICVNKKRWQLKMNEEGFCPFWNPNGGCSLPKTVRPLLCRIYPFWFNVKEDNTIEVYLCKYHAEDCLITRIALETKEEGIYYWFDETPESIKEVAEQYHKDIMDYKNKIRNST